MISKGAGGRAEARFLKLIVAALVATAPVSGCAPRRPPMMAGPPGGGPGFRGGLIAEPIGLVFVGFDADHDGCTTRTELQAGAGENWQILDADGNGAGSPLELSDWALVAMGSAEATPGRIAFDRDANGSITAREFDAQFETEFARLDVDGSACIERDELVDFVEPRGMGGPPGGGGPMGGGRRPPGGPGGGPPGGGPPGGGPPDG